MITMNEERETNLETPIAKAPHADIAHTLIVPDDDNWRFLLFPGPVGRLLAEVLAHVPPEFNPQDAVPLAVGLGHGGFLQTAVFCLCKV